MAIPVRAVGSILVFELAPILTYLAGQELLSRVKDGGLTHRHYLLEMSNVKYIDSAGVGALLELYREVQVRGGSVKLVRSPERARRLLELTGLSAIFENFDSESDAIASIEGAAAAC